MSRLEATSLREKTSHELQDQLQLEKKKLFDGIVRSASGEAIKPHEKRDGKRLVARIQCILRERVLRRKLDVQIADLTPKAQTARIQFTRLVKAVDERTALIKTELGKAADIRKVKPMLRRVRVHGRDKEQINSADRAAIALAEAKRLRASLDRADLSAE